MIQAPVKVIVMMMTRQKMKVSLSEDKEDFKLTSMISLRGLGVLLDKKVQMYWKANVKTVILHFLPIRSLHIVYRKIYSKNLMGVWYSIMMSMGANGTMMTHSVLTIRCLREALELLMIAFTITLTNQKKDKQTRKQTISYSLKYSYHIR